MKYTYRLKKNKVLRFVLKKGEYYSGKYVVIHTSKTNFKNNKNSKENNYNYFCVCISKKNGNSVSRNLLKRWAREVYKEEEYKLKKGRNIVVLYKKTTKKESIDFWILKKDIQTIFERLGLYEQGC